MSGYTVYIHTGPTGKVYVGITRQPVCKRWRHGEGYKHSPHFYAAIKRYGWAAFQHEIVAEGLAVNEAECMEVELIKRHKSTDPAHGYNVDRGGSTGPKHSDETRAKIASANRRRVWTNEARAKVRASQTGRRPSEATRHKMAEAQRGRKHSPDTIEKIRGSAKKRSVRNETTGMVYEGVGQAARACGLDPSKITAVCKGRRRTCGGCVWVYEEVML